MSERCPFCGSTEVFTAEGDHTVVFSRGNHHVVADIAADYCGECFEVGDFAVVAKLQAVVEAAVEVRDYSRWAALDSNEPLPVGWEALDTALEAVGRECDRGG